MNPSDQKPNQQQSNPLIPKGNEVAVAVPEEEMLQLAAVAAATAQLIPSVYFAKGKEMGEISEKINVLGDENNKLREKLKTFKRDNAAMNQKIGSLQDRNQKQEETIRALESSQEKLQKELENVKKAKERLRIEIEEKTSKLSTENEKLTEKLEALTKDFEAVEKENKELKRSLEKLTNSNDSLTQTVHSISEENKQLKDEMKQIREKLERKETRLELGQVACLLEAEIWKVVLPDKRRGHTGILRSMEYWLTKNRSSPEGKAAQERWDNLKSKLNWNEDHKQALKQLKDLRNEIAHPANVDPEVARKQLKDGDYVAETDKETCEQIINMLVIAQNLNNSI